MKKKTVFITMLVITILAFLNVGLADTLTDADRATDALIFDQIDSYNPFQEYQIRSRNSEDFDHSSDSFGLCNISALTTLLNRRLKADYQSSSMTSYSVMQSISSVTYVKMSDTIYSDLNCHTTGKKLYRYCFFHGNAGNWYSTVYSVCSTNRKVLKTKA